MDLIAFLIIVGVIGAIIYFLYKWMMEGYRGTNVSTEKNKHKKEPSIRVNEQPTYRFSRIIETKTIYQSAGTEERTIDNSKSNGVVKRRLTISREWRKTVSISKESSNRIRAKIGVPYSIIEVEIDKTLKDRYGVSEEETKYFSEEIELEIGAHTKIVMHVNWKIIWQTGEIEMESETGEVLVIPYKIVKGVTFDQVQERIS